MTCMTSAALSVITLFGQTIWIQSNAAAAREKCTLALVSGAVSTCIMIGWRLKAYKPVAACIERCKTYQCLCLSVKQLVDDLSRCTIAQFQCWSAGQREGLGKRNRRIGPCQACTLTVYIIAVYSAARQLACCLLSRVLLTVLLAALLLN